MPDKTYKTTVFKALSIWQQKDSETWTGGAPSLAPLTVKRGPQAVEGKHNEIQHETQWNTRSCAGGAERPSRWKYTGFTEQGTGEKRASQRALGSCGGPSLSIPQCTDPCMHERRPPKLGSLWKDQGEKCLVLTQAGSQLCFYCSHRKPHVPRRTEESAQEGAGRTNITLGQPKRFAKK